MDTLHGTHAPIDQYLEDIERAGGEGILNQERTQTGYRASAKHMEVWVSRARTGTAILSRIRPKFTHAKHVHVEIEETKTYEKSINMNHGISIILG